MITSVTRFITKTGTTAVAILEPVTELHQALTEKVSQFADESKEKTQHERKVATATRKNLYAAKYNQALADSTAAVAEIGLATQKTIREAAVADLKTKHEIRRTEAMLEASFTEQDLSRPLRTSDIEQQAWGNTATDSTSDQSDSTSEPSPDVTIKDLLASTASSSFATR